MAARAPKTDIQTPASIAPKAVRTTRKAAAAAAPQTARAVAAKLKAVQQAAAISGPPVARTAAERLAAARASMSISALRAQAALWRAQAEASGVRTAAMLVAVGIGWTIGANTFDSGAPSRKLIDTMTAFASRLEEVETVAKRAQAQDVAGLRASVSTLQASVEANRAQTNTAIIEFSAKVDALDRDSAARMVFAARDASVRFEKQDRDIAARLGEVDRFVARTSERIQKLEQRSEDAVSVEAPTTAVSAPAARAPAPVPRQRPQMLLPPLAIPAETTLVPAQLPRSLGAARIPTYGYVLRDVREGVAVLEGRSGLREVAPGDVIPGAGRVRAIERRGQEWVVVTSIGVIDGKGY